MGKRVLGIIIGLAIVATALSLYGNSLPDKSYSEQLRENCAAEFPADADGERECVVGNMARTIVEDRRRRIDRAGGR